MIADCDYILYGECFMSLGLPLGIIIAVFIGAVIWSWNKEKKWRAKYLKLKEKKDG